MILEGKVWRYGDNVDTDVIIPARYLNTADPKELAAHCMEDIDESFAKNVKPGDSLINEAIEKIDAVHVQSAWAKALERRIQDPEGAITSARTLIESVCKHILDEAKVQYDDKQDLPKLYKQTAELLNLSPSQHTEDVFKQILGGCTAVIEGLGSLRNRLSDAHGKGKVGVKPAPRHAELAVNLSGALAIYLLATWENKE